MEKLNCKDVRIGNYLHKFNTKQLSVVTEIKQDYYTDSDFDSILFRDAKPIELTEEWKERFSINISVFYSENGIKMLSIKTPYFEVDCSFILLEYVHQLQNLYFALTGEELTILINATNNK